MRSPLVFFAPAFLWITSAVHAQDFKSPPTKPPSAETLKTIAAKTTQLGRAISQLRKQGVRDPGLAEVEVYHQAALKIVQHNEFFHADSGDWTLEVLDRGLLRARFLATGEMPWATAAGYAVPRAYRSRIDGSVQPYAVTLPASYGKDPLKTWRVDVVLHGRTSGLTEVKFLKDMGDKAAAADQHFIKIDIFGRGNNAYRWAGETDIFETIDAFWHAERLVGRDRLLDPGRVVLRGFSMGGAGTWHLGLHFPDRWAVIGPGAGFTTTHGYAKSLPETLPEHQEACLKIYDAVEYAENAVNVPVVAYSGAKDPQKAAADNIEARLKKHGLAMTHLVAPDLEHSFPPEWLKKADAHYTKYADRGRPDHPARVHFVTYTLKYPSCFWVEILGLNRHYQRSSVDAQRTDKGYVVHTANVSALHLTLPDGVAANQAIDIDKQKLEVKPWLNPTGSYHVYLQMRDGKWTSVMPQRLATERAQKPRKTNSLTGPIDDAFTEAFLCVRGTDKPWNDGPHKEAEARLDRFQKEWAKFFRGTLPIKDDVDVTSEDISSKNLILFGDPGSNALIAQVLDGLPMQWNSRDLVFGGGTFASGDHLPILIHPNPLNANRYVVLNSGHTFHTPDFEGTNALLFPRLGDWAVVGFSNVGGDQSWVTKRAGLFDEFWK